MRGSSDIVGIIRDPDTRAVLPGSWPQVPGDVVVVVVSPPVSLHDLAGRAGILILEASGEKLPESLEALRPLVGAGTAIVTTSPLVSLSVLRSCVGAGPALFRAVMPVGGGPGEGVAALAPEPGTAAETVERVRAALAWIGAVETVGEDALDAVAALAIGGAGFLCEALRGLEEGAVQDGLPLDTARAFAHHTLLATALLLRDHAGSPADLKDQVASPGGTTIAALATLEDAGVRGAYIRALQRTAVEVRRRRDAARLGVVE